ncbi:hypothetical protein J4216_04700 [Candidatus Woesearchaeota archaeon]|nr:hypothetical protein [Candidatus Woesearchaeota archaeon]
MKHQLLKYRYGNRGLIFTLDIIVAVIVFSIALVLSVYYVSQASENKIPQIQMANIGSDIISLMDNKGVLQTLDSSTIENEKNLVLPKAYEMRILIQTKNNKTIDVGGIPSNGILTISGKKYFITNEDYAEVNYWIWQKE